MKKLFFLLFTFLTIGAVANAQGGRGGQSPEAIAQGMKDSLQLSDKQVDSVKAIYQEFMPKQREIFMNQEMSREDKMAKLQEFSTALNARLKGVLSEEQYKKFLEMSERRRQRMQQGGGRSGGN
jgi:hypothetical protein